MSSFEFSDVVRNLLKSLSDKEFKIFINYAHEYHSNVKGNDTEKNQFTRNVKQIRDDVTQSVSFDNLDSIVFGLMNVTDLEINSKCRSDNEYKIRDLLINISSDFIFNEINKKNFDKVSIKYLKSTLKKVLYYCEGENSDDTTSRLNSLNIILDHSIRLSRKDNLIILTEKDKEL
ncbi:hypothetical protein [Alkalihalobacillus pseudalcaliphilus]|uniref:hypothetical protein n=1 Tax=Alkalihalobacillus pseudalcaliphilus TaxID=79884 RepID=UPI00064DB3F0|nr:hypothetical protein [Alkalihalobacillus pseudalcaliphilus]KMK76739.1 hypothetical protein AB990_07430 [Alkalihalobacillus pseudalcaliphilus]